MLTRSIVFSKNVINPFSISLRFKSSKKKVNKEDNLDSLLSNQEEPGSELSPEEQKIRNVIEEMKNIKGHITTKGRGKFSIEYPELKGREKEISKYLKDLVAAQQNQNFLDNEKFGEDFKNRTYHESFVYWASSAEFTSFILLCLFFGFGFQIVRYSGENYYLKTQAVKLKDDYEEKITQLENELIELNKTSNVEKE